MESITNHSSTEENQISQRNLEVHNYVTKNLYIIIKGK